MDGRIGQLHCRYRVPSGQVGATGLTTRLDRVARANLAECYGQALDQALGGDPAVYVVRQIETRLAMILDGQASDAAIAERWGICLAAAVARAITSRETGHGYPLGRNDAGAEVLRFADQADYVAHFVLDLLDNVAWDRWFYGAFARWRTSTRQEALEGVLLENVESLPAILAHLSRHGVLARVLDELGGRAHMRLWAALREESPLQDAAWHSLFGVVQRLGDRLELWAAGQPDRQSLAAFLASGPAPPDWRDRTGLTQAILALFRHLALRGFFRVRGHAEGQPLYSEEGLVPHVPSDALSELDWLDREQLQKGLEAILMHGPVAYRRSMSGLQAYPASSAEDTPDEPDIATSQQAVADLPLRRAAQGPTPRQQRLLADLLDTLRNTRATLQANVLDAPEMALRLYATLLDHHPGWAGDVLAPEMIQRLLVACQWLRQTPSPAAAIAGLRQRDVERVLVALAPGDHVDAKASLVFLAGLGASGLAVVEALVTWESAVGRTASHPGSPDPSTGSGGQAVSQDFLTRTSGEVSDEILTPSAGTALLIRALLDLRRPTLYEPASLLALFLRWAGVAATAEGWIDPGLLVLAGLSEAQHRAAPGEPGPLNSTEALVRHWRSATPATLLGDDPSWLRTLAGQRVLAGDALHLYSLPLATGGYALVAGDATAALWPLGQVIETSDQAGEVVAGWLAAWTTAMGRPPVLVAEDPLLATARSSDAEVAALTSDQALPATHVAGRTRLTAAFEALAPGQLGLPAIDLAVALAAGVLLRLWARWLRNFGESNVPYLLDQFIRRPGSIWVTSTEIVVTLDRRPLDIVLEMAGYLGEIERVSWLGDRRVRFRLRGVG